MMLFRGAAALVVVVMLAGAAAAQSPTFALDGKVKAPLHFALDDLKKLPA